MLKFLRLYQGWILAVFGTILLITFLLPQAITGLFQYSAVTGGDWATIGNDNAVTNGELLQVQKELLVLDQLPPEAIPLIINLGANTDPAYWYLLTHEAEQAGLVGGPGQGEQLLTNIVQQFQARGQQVTETLILSRLMGGSGLSDRQVKETLAKVQGITELSRQFATAARYSDERLRQAAADLGLAVNADVVILDAKKESETSDDASSGEAASEEAPTTTVAATQEPTEEELQELFEKYKADNPGEGQSGFGYKLPDRARLEWITVAKEDAKTGLNENAQLDPIELRKEFISNPDAYGAGTTGDEAPKFADYQELVRERVLRNMLEERMAEIEKFLSDQTQLPRRGLERDGIEYVLPADWQDKQANFEELAMALGEEFQMAPGQASSSRGLLSANEINSLPGIGTSLSAKFGTTPIQPSKYIMAASEFDSGNSIPAQLGIASPVFKDAAGNLYIFRITEVDPAREPKSLDEVREQVTANAKTLARFKALEAKAPELEREATEYGLQPIAEKYDTKVNFSSNLAKADPFALGFGVKSPTRILGLSQSEAVIDAIIARASKLDYTKPATEIPVSDRTLVIPDEENLAVAVVQITAIKPMTKESWTDLAAKGAMIRILASEETGLDLAETFSLNALEKRHNFKTLRVQNEDSTDLDIDVDADADPDADADKEATATTSASDEKTVG